ncbi:unnamed protein product [Trichobilharzia regenti]|nr:unnamed protein product [Trichobilharzia regenti]
MIVPSSTPNTDILKPRTSSKLAAYNVGTLIQIGHQVGPVRSLERLAVDFCCILETRIQDPSEMLRISSLSEGSNSMHHPLLSGDPVTLASGVAGVTLNSGVKAALLDLNPHQQPFMCCVTDEKWGLTVSPNIPVSL